MRTAFGIPMLVMLLAACDGCEGRDAERAGPTETAKPGAAPGARSPATSQEAPSEPTEGAEPDLTEPMAEHMKDHFQMVTQARDAVIRGEITQAQGPLIWLAQHSYAGEIPEAWQAHVDAMQGIARRAQTTSSIVELGAHVADLAAQCGACHAAQNAQVELGPAGFERLLDEGDAEDVPERMHRHLWAAERMWEALIAPAPERFDAASGALLEAPALGKGAGPQVRAGVDAVQALAKQAQQATTMDARAEAFGQLLGRCSTCHQAHAVKPGLTAP